MLAIEMKKTMHNLWLPIVIIIVLIAIPFIKSEKSIKKYYEGPEALKWLKKQ